MTRSDACEIAGGVFAHLLGTQPSEFDTSTQSAYSVRRQAIIREWSVLCSTPKGQYLLRINADTKRVYAINSMDDLTSTARKVDPSLEESDAPDTRISHAEAEARAKSYIALIGISTKNLTPVLPHADEPKTTASEVAEPEWNFTFRNNATQTHNHLVTISVRSKDGRLEHLWNPVLSL